VPIPSHSDWRARRVGDVTIDPASRESIVSTTPIRAMYPDAGTVRAVTVGSSKP
jgi:hypothetical protein